MSRAHLLSFPLKSYLLLRHPSARDNRQNLVTGLIRSNLFHSSFNFTLFVSPEKTTIVPTLAGRHLQTNRKPGGTKSIDASKNLDYPSSQNLNTFQICSSLCFVPFRFLCFSITRFSIDSAVAQAHFFAFPRVVLLVGHSCNIGNAPIVVGEKNENNDMCVLDVYLIWVYIH